LPILTVLFRVLVTVADFDSAVQGIGEKSATVTYTLNSTVKISNGHPYPEQHCQNQQRSPILTVLFRV
jgi:hypothetical protein